MRLSLLLCFLLSIMASSHASADTRWSKIGFTGGGVSDLVSFPSNPDVMLACVAGHGIYRSADRGGSWTRIVDGSWNDVSISEDGVAFIAGESGVMDSHDNGESWVSCFDSSAWKVVAYRGGIVAIGPGGFKDYNYFYPPLQLSRDNGKTWEGWEDTGNTRSLFFHENGSVYRSADFVVYRSGPDNWSAWTQMFATSYFGPDLRFGFSDGDSVLYGYSEYVDQHPGGFIAGGVFRITVAGPTWHNFTNIQSVTAMERSGDTAVVGTPEGAIFALSLATGEADTIGTLGGEVTAIDAKRFDSGELVVATKGGIFKTDDGGLHWLRRDAGIPHPEISSVVVIPAGPGGERVIASTRESGVFYSDDRGENWTWADPGVRTIPGLLRVSRSSPRRIYAAESSIHVSRDNGESWKRIGYAPVSYYGWYGRSVDIEIDPRDSDRIAVNYYSHSLDHMVGIHYFDGRLSDESDDTWDIWEWRVPFDSGEQFKSGFSEDGSLIWVSANRYGETVKPLLVALNDAGEVVRSIALPSESGYYYWLIEGQSCYVFCEEEKRFWSSPDLGETWESTEMAINDYALRYYYYLFSAAHHGDLALSPDGKTLYLLYPGNGILASGDRGRTWTALNDGLDTTVVFHLAFSPSSPGVMYAATADGLYRSETAVAVRDGESAPEPVPFGLSRNVPNPFNSSTVIRFNLAQAGSVRLSVFSVTGQKIRDLISEPLGPGEHSVVWDGCDDSGYTVSAGVYIARLQSGSQVATQKMMLMK